MSDPKSKSTIYLESCYHEIFLKLGFHIQLYKYNGSKIKLYLPISKTKYQELIQLNNSFLDTHVDRRLYLWMLAIENNISKKIEKKCDVYFWYVHQ